MSKKILHMYRLLNVTKIRNGVKERFRFHATFFPNGSTTTQQSLSDNSLEGLVCAVAEQTQKNNLKRREFSKIEFSNVSEASNKDGNFKQQEPFSVDEKLSFIQLLTQ